MKTKAAASFLIVCMMSIAGCFTVPTGGGALGEQCGNNYCGSGENVANCPDDCGGTTTGGGGVGERCGNGLCGSGENASNCPVDCGGSLGNGDVYVQISGTLCSTPINYQTQASDMQIVLFDDGMGLIGVAALDFESSDLLNLISGTDVTAWEPFRSQNDVAILLGWDDPIALEAPAELSELVEESFIAARTVGLIAPHVGSRVEITDLDLEAQTIGLTFRIPNARWISSFPFDTLDPDEADFCEEGVVTGTISGKFTISDTSS